jgi:hypothetical protein
VIEDDTAKRAFEKVFNAMVSVVERSISRKTKECRAKARAIAAICVWRNGGCPRLGKPLVDR